jgi:hypothetical protein
MGGSSKQVTGYQYFANFLLFIGNPIEKLLNINFDKRGWIANERISYRSNGEMIYIEKPNLYGENEGGVYGTLRVKHGTNTQTPCTLYKKYLDENGIPVSAYPYQSYILFGGGGFPQGAYGLSEAELEAVGDELEVNDRYYNGGFYLGNSGYMKEMLLWPKRTRIRNDGSAQWYANTVERPWICEIGTNQFTELSATAKAEIESVKWKAIDQNSGVTVSDKKLTEQFSFYFTTGGTIGAIGQIAASINFSKPVFNGYFFINGSADDTGILEVTNASAILLDSFGIPSFGAGYVWLIKIDDGATSVDLSFKVTNTQTIYHAARISLSYESSYDIEPYAPENYDINPIHKIREILTDDTAMNKPESDVNNINFMKAADRIWDEGLGISWAITEKSCIDAINELCSHIEAGIRINRQTGLYEMVLFRDDFFEESEIHALAESKIKSISFEVQNADDVVNQLNVSYYDRNNIKDASFSISENASIKNMQGRVNAESADFPYFMNQRNAAIVAQWKLKQFTSPCWKGTFTTGFNEARKWNRYDIVKLNWSRKGIVDLPVRIMSINLGDGVDNTVSIDFVEVVPFSDELTSTVVIDDKIDTAPLPPQPILFKAFELSYFEAVQAQGQRTVDDELAYNPDAGYVAVVAQRSQNNSLNAQMHTDAGTGYENSAVIQYCETAQLDQLIDRLTSSFILKNVGDLESVRIGSQIFINNEIMVFQGFDTASKLLTVKRGALDSIPQIHADDSVLFFADDFVAIDSTEYADSEVINVKALSTTPSGVLDLNAVSAQSVEIQSRAIRPYPPANVKVNGEYWPEEVETDLILTWVDRNRSQQTGGSILGWFDTGVTLENGVTYQLILIERDASEIELRTQNLSLGTLNTYTFATSAMNANTRTIEITLKSLRNGYECYQSFNHTVELSQFFSAPYNLNVEFKND